MNNAKRKKKEETGKAWETGNSMGKMREIFKKTGNIKGTFHARMAMIKDMNSKDLTQKQKRLGRGGKNTEELYKKGLNDLDNHDGMVNSPTARYPGVQSQGALGRITANKASRDNKVSAEVFKI